MSTARIKALDLFAGTGWGAACKRLGIKEMGVEIMPEAIATREANGMETIYRDVWDGLKLTAEQFRAKYGSFGLVIGSPPCQTFSLAGKGAGRAALDEVLEAIELHAYKDVDALLSFGELHDMRTALVLTPLAYIWRDMPKLVALEQVPTVLPVWEACAEVMREWGYEVKVEVLNAEQYGVPQTRKRAILVARRGGPVDLPTPTHSRYYSRTPDKLDIGVKKWVSMAEALGWGGDETHWTGNNKLAHQSVRPLTAPAATITAGHDSGNRGFIDSAGNFTVATVDEVAVIQSYPAGRGLTDRPSPTITGGGTETGGAEPIAKFHERYTGAPGWVGATGRLTTDEAAALQTYPAWLRSNYSDPLTQSGRGERSTGEPAPTLTSKALGNKWDGDRNMTGDEAASLQTFESPFVFCGAKGKQFLQIGNAVPPLLAEHILAALIGIPTSQAAS